MPRASSRPHWLSLVVLVHDQVERELRDRSDVIGVEVIERDDVPVRHRPALVTADRVAVGRCVSADPVLLRRHPVSDVVAPTRQTVGVNDVCERVAVHLDVVPQLVLRISEAGGIEPDVPTHPDLVVGGAFV